MWRRGYPGQVAMSYDHSNRWYSMWRRDSDGRNGRGLPGPLLRDDPDIIRTGVGETPAFSGYDMEDVPLGDLMRGERATLGKSLLDVERELRIGSTYIAAIENNDLDSFHSPGFIAGYVRSYARYLGIDPEWTFARFCAETGFRSIHGLSAEAGRSSSSMASAAVPRRVDPNEVMLRAHSGFGDTREPFLSRVEIGALGSFSVLAALALAIGYGAWVVVQDIQRVTFAPVDEAPVSLAQFDPVDGLGQSGFDIEDGFSAGTATMDQGFGRLERPEPLAAPVITPRDSALALLDPDETGTLSGLRPALSGQAAVELAEGALGAGQTPGVQVTQQARPDEVMIFAVRPTWVRVTSPGGATLFEGTLNAGDSYVVAEGDGAPQLRSGNAGSLYFAVNGVTFGPAGTGASIVREVELSANALTSDYTLADPSADPDLTRVAELVLTPETN